MLGAREEKKERMGERELSSQGSLYIRGGDQDMNTNRNHTKYIEVKYPKGDRNSINNCHLFNTQCM